LHSFLVGRRTANLPQGPRCGSELRDRNLGIAAIDIGNRSAPGRRRPKRKRQRMRSPCRTIGAKTERERGYIDAIAAYYAGYPDQSHGARLKALASAFRH